MGVDVIREQGKITSEDALYTPLVQKGRSVFLCFQVESHKATPKATSITSIMITTFFMFFALLLLACINHPNCSNGFLFLLKKDK